MWGAAAAAPTWTHLANPAWQTGGYSTTKTFTGVSIGTAGTGNITVVAAAHCDTASGTQSCTVGGASATLISTSGATDAVAVVLWAITTPGGSTADIVIGDSVAFSAAGIWVGQLTGVNATPSNTGTAQAFGFKSSVISCPALTVPSGGYGITATVFQGTDPTWGVATGNNSGTSTSATATNGQTYKLMTAYQTASGTPTLTGTSNNFAIVGAAWGA
jgi:hypothetical protein